LLEVRWVWDGMQTLELLKFGCCSTEMIFLLMYVAL